MNQKKRETQNTGFVCANCGKPVPPLDNGSYRNHCPYCLYSLHVDDTPGDRNSDCLGLMRPVGIVYNSKKGYQIVHRCDICGAEKVNRIAEGCKIPDDAEVMIALMRQK